MDESSTPTKVCTKCGAVLPATLEFFYIRRDQGALNTQCKECRRRKTREYVAAHRDEWNARSRRYYAEHHDERIEYGKHYREENAGVLAKRKRADYLAHQAKRNEAVQRWCEQHRERRREIANDWRRRHPEVGRITAARRYAHKLGAQGLHTMEDVAAQYKRQKGRCYWGIRPECRDRKLRLPDDWHVDHVIPLALGGSDGPENIVIACRECNQSKNARHPMEYGRLC